MDAVVCWDSLVADEAAVWFSLGFTRALAARDGARAAFSAAVTSVLSVTEPGRLDNGIGGWGESATGPRTSAPSPDVEPSSRLSESSSYQCSASTAALKLASTPSFCTVQKFEMGDPEAVVSRTNLMRGRREAKHGGRVVAGVPWLLQRLASDRLVRVPHARGLALRQTVSERRLVGALHGIAYSVAGTSARGSTTIALAGQAGAGKTFLAAWFARDPRTQALARDGVMWIDCGRTTRAGDVMERLLLDLRALSSGVAVRDEIAAEAAVGTDSTLAALADALRSRHCLVVLDDVWSAAPLEPILSTAAPSLILVFTTRNHALARACAGGEHDSVIIVPKLDDASASELLCSSAFPATEDAFTSNRHREALASLPATRSLLELCCGSPLVLVAAGSLVADCAATAIASGSDSAGAAAAAERAVASALTAALEVLRMEGLAGLPALGDPSYAFPTITASVEATLDELGSDARRRCEQLAVADGGAVRIAVLREWWSVPLATGTSELRVWGLLRLTASPGAAAAMAAIQLSPLLRGLLLARMADDDVARWRAELKDAEARTATTEKLSSIGGGGLGFASAAYGVETVCDDGMGCRHRLSLCVRLHPVTSLCVRRPAVRGDVTVASILLALSLSLLLVVRCCPSPDLFVRVVRVSYYRDEGDAEPGSGPLAMESEREGDPEAKLGELTGGGEPPQPEADMTPEGGGGIAWDEGPVAEMSASEVDLAGVESWPSVLPTLDTGERLPDLNSSPGASSWLQGAVDLSEPQERRRRRLGAPSAPDGGFQSSSLPRFHLEWMPVWQMLATRDALAQVMTERLAALDELSVHQRFQLELSSQWGVYLPTDAEGRSIAKFHATWTPGSLVLLALGASALALSADCCARLIARRMSRYPRRWAAFECLARLVTLSGCLCAVFVTAVALSMASWFNGPNRWRASERVAVYTSDGQEGGVRVAAEYFVADYVGCASPPFVGCGLWGGGAVDAFTLAVALWMFVLAPAALVAALLALALWANRRRRHPATGRYGHRM